MINKPKFPRSFLDGKEFPMIVPEHYYRSGDNFPYKTSFVLEAMKIAREREIPMFFTYLETEAKPEPKPYYLCQNSLRCKRCNKYWPDKCECLKSSLTEEELVVV